LSRRNRRDTEDGQQGRFVQVFHFVYFSLSLIVSPHHAGGSVWMTLADQATENFMPEDMPHLF
jgi:hypothetical protein